MRELHFVFSFAAGKNGNIEIKELRMPTPFVNLLAFDAACLDNTFYFLGYDLNIIFSYDMDSGQIRLIDMIPEDFVVKRETAGCIAATSNELYFGPDETKFIWIYNLDFGKWTKISLKELPCYEAPCLLQAIVYGDNVYFAGGSYPAIVKVNIHTKEIRYIEEPFDVCNIIAERNDLFSRCQHELIEGNLYLPCCIDNCVLKINLDTEKFQWLEIGEKYNRFAGITFDGTSFWLSPRLNTPIVKWDGKSSVNEFPLPNEFTQKSCNLSGCLGVGKQIFFYGLISDFSLAISSENQLSVFPGKYAFAKRIDDSISVFQEINGQLHVLRYGEEIHRLDMKLPVQRIQDFYLEKGKTLDFSTMPLQEGRIVDLPGFLECI